MYKINPEKYDALIFDCDGTLVDTLPAHYLAWKESLSSFQLDAGEITEDFYMQHLAGKNNPQTIYFLNKHFDVSLTDEVGYYKEKLFIDKYIGNATPIDKITTIVKNWHGKKPLAVASSGFREAVYLTLKLNKLTHYFNEIIVSEDVNNRVKPSPDLFILAAKKLNIDCEKCHVFEDSKSGIIAAKKAGMSYTNINLMI